MLKRLEQKIFDREGILINKFRSHFIGYLLAVVLIVLALLIRLAIAPQEAGIPFLTFFPAIVLVALLCGRIPALLAVIITAIAGNYLFFPPFSTFKLTQIGIFSVVLYILESLVVIWIIESLFQLRERYMFAVAKLKQSQQNELEMKIASTVFDTTHESIMITDANGVIININQAFTENTGFSREEVLGQSPRMFKSGRQHDGFYENVFNSIKVNGHWKGEIWNKHKNGKIVPYLQTISAIKAMDGNISHYVAMYVDISKLKEAYELTQKLAFFDFLTDLPNRSWFHDRFEYELNESRRHNALLALIILDIDQFKVINDEFGTQAGDSVLKEVAKRLLNTVRKTDTVARLGGDEFAVVLSGLTEINNVDHVAQTIVETFQQPFSFNNHNLQLSVRMGIAVYPNKGIEIGLLMACAYQALQVAKDQLSANSYCFFTQSMQEEANFHLRLINDLRVALDRQEFEVYYQPIVELMTGRVYKAEALIRWIHPIRGMVSPAEFIPVAENIGLIDKIGDWVFSQAVKQVEQWRSTLHPDFQISVNKSPVQFRSNEAVNIHKAWIDHLQTLGLPGDSITLEITEGVLMNANATSQQELATLIDCGMQFAIDDFGTGYSSLAYLKKFDIDYLKIDQSFVKNLTLGSTDLALCEAIIIMAHKLGLKVIAEGIETLQHLDLLVQAGCDYGQGYLFAKPMPVADFEKWRLPTNLTISGDSV